MATGATNGGLTGNGGTTAKSYRIPALDPIPNNITVSPEGWLLPVYHQATDKTYKGSPAELAAGLSPHTNNGRGSLKIVRDLTRRADLKPALLTAGNQCIVLNAVTAEEDDAGLVLGMKTYTLALASSNEADSFLLPADAVVGLPEQRVKWVLNGTPEADAATILTFDRTADYTAGFVFKFQVDGPYGDVIRVYQVLNSMNAADFPGGVLPDPTDVDEDDYYKQVAPPAPPYVAFQEISVSTARSLATIGAVTENRLYRINRRLLPPVLVRGLDSNRYDLQDARQFNAGASQWEVGTYNLANNEFTVGAPDGGGSDGVATIYREGERIELKEAAELNTLVQPTDIVRINTPLNLDTWVLVHLVTYYTQGIPLSVGMITDDGQSVSAKVLGGSPRIYTRARRIYLNGPATDVTFEGDLYPTSDGLYTVELNGYAILRHRGLLGGWGGGAIAARLNGGSKYYFEGKTDFGGGVGVRGGEDSYAEIRATVPGTFNFRPAIWLTQNAQVDYYGGLSVTGNIAYPLRVNAQLEDNSFLRLKTGAYLNNVNAAVTLSGGAQLEVSSIVTLNASDLTVAGTGTLRRHAGATIGAISDTVNIVELDNDAPSSTYTGQAFEDVELAGNELSLYRGNGTPPITLTLPGGAGVTAGQLETVRATIAASAAKNTDYTLALGDAGNIVPIDSGTPLTVTIPASSAVAFPIGTVLEIEQQGAGQVTVAGASGVTVNGYGGLKTAGQWASVGLRKVAANTWILKGGVV